MLVQQYKSSYICERALSNELLENDLNIQTVGNFTTVGTDNERKAISHSQNLKWHLAQILRMSVPGTFETWSSQSISACLYWKLSHTDLCVKIKIFLSPKEDIFIPTCLFYLSHQQRLLLLHTALETKTPWRSAGQCNHHFLRHHCLAFFLLFLLSYSLIALLFFVSIAGAPQCFSPMLSNQGPLQRALTCSLPATLLGCWAEVQLQGPHSHLNTHPQGLMSTLPHPEWVNLHREA